MKLLYTESEALHFPYGYLAKSYLKYFHQVASCAGVSNEVMAHYVPQFALTVTVCQIRFFTLIEKGVFHIVFVRRNLEVAFTVNV